MELLKLISGNPLIVLVTLILIAAASYMFFYRRIEKFQDVPVAAGESVATGAPVRLPKETCEPLKSQLDQYKKVRQEHKDVMIVDLDTTIETLQEYYVKYGCDLHRY
jgi:hypothetical protein